MTYQLIAFDMDGTLLQSDQTISSATSAAIVRANNAGKFVVLATGRSVSELRPYYSSLSGIRYGVLASGGLLYDFQTETVLVKKSLPKAVIRKIQSLLQTEDLFVVVMKDGQGYIQSSQFERIDQFFMAKYTQLYLNTAQFVPDMLTFLDQGEFEKINIYFKTSLERDQQLERFSSCFVNLIRSEVTGLELSSLGADKGTGLTQLCDLIGIEMTDVIGVGDADNDITMFEQVGLGLAMGNANTSIKNLANAILPDHDHHGCVIAIDHYLLDN